MDSYSFYVCHLLINVTFKSNIFASHEDSKIMRLFPVARSMLQNWLVNTAGADFTEEEGREILLRVMEIPGNKNGLVINFIRGLKLYYCLIDLEPWGGGEGKVQTLWHQLCVQALSINNKILQQLGIMLGLCTKFGFKLTWSVSSLL